MALVRANRLKHRNDFKRVYQRGRRRKSKNLTLLALRRNRAPGKDLKSFSKGLNNSEVGVASPTQIGISISQKVSKRAVVRNRIKRQIRAVMRFLLPGFPHGWNLVIVVHPSAVQCDYLEFLRELEQLLIDAEVLHGHS